VCHGVEDVARVQSTGAHIRALLHDEEPGKELGLGCRQFYVCDAKRGSIFGVQRTVAAVPPSNILPISSAEHAHAEPARLDPHRGKERFWYGR